MDDCDTGCRVSGLAIMWGTWFITTLGVTVGVALLVIAFAFGGWAVVVALGAFAVIGAALLAGAGWRRSGEYVAHEDEGKAAAQPRGAHDSPGQPQSGGAPVSGEGS